MSVKKKPLPASKSKTKVSPRVEKLARKMKQVRSLQGELAGLYRQVEEKEEGIRAGMADIHFMEEDGLEGDELFRMQFKHKKQLLTKTSVKMEEKKHEFGKLKKAKRELIGEMIELDKGSIEDTLPLIVSSKLGSDPDNAWKDIPVRHLMRHGLAESIVEKMEEGGLDTLGKVHVWREKHTLTDVEGVREADEGKYDDARDEFLEAAKDFLTAPDDKESEKPEPKKAKPVKEEEEEEEEVEDKVEPDAATDAEEAAATLISELELPADVIGKIEEAGFETIAGLKQYIKDNGIDGIKKAIGAKHYDKMREALKAAK